MEERIKMMIPQLNEKQKRLFLASEAISYGRGGIAEVIKMALIVFQTDRQYGLKMI